MRLSLCSFLAILAAGLLCSVAPAQTGADVKCGAMLRSDLTLTADLNCASLKDAPALLVVAPGVTVNLNGFAVRGGGSGYGVMIAGADYVTVTNGDVTGFSIGVIATPFNGDRPYSPKITNIRSTKNTLFGIVLDAASFGEVSNSEASDNGLYGILAWTGTDGSRVADNLVLRNGSAGIYAGCDPRSIDPKSGASSACDGKNSNDNTIEGNTVIGNGWTKGDVSAGKAGIGVLFGSRNVVQNNLVMYNNTTTEGGQLNVTHGIAVFAGADNVIENNHVSNNGRGIAVAFYPNTPSVYATNTAVTGNTVLLNASSGIMVTGDYTSAVLRDNTAFVNGISDTTGFQTQCQSGIRVVAPAAVSLINNRSYENRAYGFQVETKNIMTQSGNFAGGNATAQCAGVPCR